ncbi:MAG: hypothetical protein J1E82_08755 [Muribaculaceae bacterium]|nr:hypothetical protein [Muribaculaceae bacterium]
MRKFTLCFCMLALMCVASCSKSNDKDREKEEMDSIKIAELTANYDEATTFNDSLMLLMSDIYTGLDSINMQEGLLYNMGNGESLNRREEIRRNLSDIRSRLSANQKVLLQMEQKLKASGNQNSVLSKTIEQMKQSIAQQETKISQLENQLAMAQDSISNLNRKVEAVEEEVKVQTEAKDAALQAVQEADQEIDNLNTVYYALGTNKELKQNGLLEKKFLGQTKVLKGQFNESYFTKVDKRNLSSIPTGAKKIKIWTNMPAGSYEEVKGEDGYITLKITNPQQFWSLSPFLVIQLD